MPLMLLLLLKGVLVLLLGHQHIALLLQDRVHFVVVQSVTN